MTTSNPTTKDETMETKTDTMSITTSTCDDCGRRGPGIEYTSCGAPVYFTCRHCEPKTFERTARADIDAWLSGGE